MAKWSRRSRRTRLDMRPAVVCPVHGPVLAPYCYLCEGVAAPAGSLPRNVCHVCGRLWAECQGSCESASLKERGAR